jgi:hypothetical protein
MPGNSSTRLVLGNDRFQYRLITAGGTFNNQRQLCNNNIYGSGGGRMWVPRSLYQVKTVEGYFARLNPSLSRYWTGLKQSNWYSFAKFVNQDGIRVTTRGVPSNGFNATGGGFPWNHWGTGEPNNANGGRCVASDKSMSFWKYDTDGTTRINDASDATNNVWGWDDTPCGESLPIICVWSCRHSAHKPT